MEGKTQQFMSKLLVDNPDVRMIIVVEQRENSTFAEGIIVTSKSVLPIDGYVALETLKGFIREQ